MVSLVATCTAQSSYCGREQHTSVCLCKLTGTSLSDGEVVGAYGNFRRYTMGRYVHSCLVMNYGSAYWAFSIACPETRTWVIVESAPFLRDTGILDGRRTL